MSKSISKLAHRLEQSKINGREGLTFQTDAALGRQTTPLPRAM